MFEVDDEVLIPMDGYPIRAFQDSDEDGQFLTVEAILQSTDGLCIGQQWFDPVEGDEPRFLTEYGEEAIIRRTDEGHFVCDLREEEKGVMVLKVTIPFVITDPDLWPSEWW